MRSKQPSIFETKDGPATLPDLFQGRSQVLVQQFMFPGCPSCSSMADGYDGMAIHLFNHDVAMVKPDVSERDHLVRQAARSRARKP